MQKRRPSPRLLAVWMVYAGLVAGLLCAGLLLLLHFVDLPLRLIGGIGALLAVLWSATVTVYLPLRYRHLAFRLTETELTVFSGILFQSQRTVPLSGVQYVTLLAGLPERLLQIGTLLVYVAGGMVLVEGVPLAEARELQKKLCAAAEVSHE